MAAPLPACCQHYTSSPPLLPCSLWLNAEQQGPDHATKHVWVLCPELRQRFGLPDELPEELQQKLAASVKLPKKKPGAQPGHVLGWCDRGLLLPATPVGLPPAYLCHCCALRARGLLVRPTGVPQPCAAAGACPA